jgi:hypothetical protein
MLAYVSTYLGGNPSSGLHYGSGTQAYFAALIGIAGDTLGNVYVSDGGANIVHTINSTGAVWL